MGIVAPFRPRKFELAPRRKSASGYWIFAVMTLVFTAAYYGYSYANIPLPHLDLQSQRFAVCGYLSRDNCVIDGDTFYFKGEKIRIADIDAPETGGAQCDYEAALGAQATIRLRELLNDGPFELRGYNSRDRDQYGRKLRVVVRGGKSLGDTLIGEGLARRWDGRRRPWCT